MTALQLSVKLRLLEFDKDNLAMAMYFGLIRNEKGNMDWFKYLEMWRKLSNETDKLKITA